jgi:hypothetical protein
VIGLLMAPMLFTSRSYASDWANNLWLVWEQSLNVKELGHPSYFLQSSLGAFYPQFLFYGGTLFSIAGVLASVAGEHPLATYILIYALAAAAAYGGWLWLCRQLGLTNIYGRGDFGETVATSAIPLVLAGGLHLVLTRRWRVAPLALFALAVVLLTGSHPLTLVWGATMLLLAAVALLPALWPQARTRGRRLAEVGGVAAIALGVNAWTLIPTIGYHDRVFHGADTVIQQTWYSTPGVLFNVLRDTANPSWITADVQTQAPVLAIAWALVVAALCWRRAPLAIRRAVLGLVALLGLLVWLVLSPSALGSLPSPWSNIQFPFRLVTYVTLTGCGLVAIALLLLGQAPARLRRGAEAAVVLVALASVGLAVRQTWHAPSFHYKSRAEVFASATTLPRSYYLVYAGPDFADTSAPVVTPTLGAVVGGSPLQPRPWIELPSTPFTSDHSYPIVVSQSGTVATNVATGPYMVTVKGASPAGRSPNGFMVVRVTGAPGQRETVSFSTAPSRALRVGLLVTVACLAALVVLLGVVFARGRRERRRAPPG